MAVRRAGMQTRSISAKGLCPNCKKRGLGNIRLTARLDAVRDCQYCGEIAALAQPQGAGPSERGSNNEPPPRGPHRPPSEDWHYDSQGYCDNPGRGY